MPFLFSKEVNVLGDLILRDTQPAAVIFSRPLCGRYIADVFSNTVFNLHDVCTS